MKLRILSSIIGLPFLIAVVVLGGNVLKVAIFALAIIALTEVYKAISGRLKSIHSVGFVLAALYLVFIDYMSDYKMLTIMLIIMTLSVLVWLVIFYGKFDIIDACVTVFGFFYVVMLFSSVYLVRNYERLGAFFVWLIFISAWGCDTGAYFSGKLFGKHKLVPKLSPKKTVEGAIGGVAVATLIAFLYGFIISRFSANAAEVRIIAYCTISGFLGSIFSQFGDLTASAIKRYNGIKDFGRIIPGHGGVMDRFDSILFTAPAIYLTVLVLMK